MSGEFPELGHVHLGNRPLIVCDVDEVVLDFIAPFQSYLEANDHRLLPRSFKLHGNIVCMTDGSMPDNATISDFLENFFATQDQWQTPAADAAETLARLSASADIVFLTAMAPRHAAMRRRVLDGFGMTFPMIATEYPKGPVVQRLHGDRDLPVVFLDDIERNLRSVGDVVPQCLLIHLMANEDFRALAPPTQAGALSARDWRHAEMLISTHCHL